LVADFVDDDVEVDVDDSAAPAKVEGESDLTTLDN